MKNETKIIPLNKIRVGDNHRSDEHEDLSGMMESIQSVGLLEPIGVAIDKGTDGYRVVYGFRRFNAVTKLGLLEIPCVIHGDISTTQEHTINLAENVQRKNTTLIEIGRWAVKMRDDGGLKMSELAVKLGVRRGYLDGAISAYNKIPEAYRSKIEVRAAGRSTGAPGTIPVRTALAISGAIKAVRLTKEETGELYDEALKHGAKFQPEQVRSYALNVKNKRPIFEGVEKMRSSPRAGLIGDREWKRLTEKYVDDVDSPYNTVSSVVRAILRGELAETVDIV